MIIEYNFANDLLEEIDTYLYSFEDNDKFRMRDISISKFADFKFMYDNIKYCLPSSKTLSSNIIGIDKSYYEILVNNWKDEHPDLVKGGVEKTVETTFRTDFAGEAISSAIRDKLTNLIYNYDNVLEVTKKNNGLFGIKDEQKILLIHLKKYNEILSSSSEQMEIINGIFLNKKISDLVLQVYVRFINLRLEMLTPEHIETTVKPAKSSKKLVWLGEQQDLCELFVVLQEKGFIETVKEGQRNKTSQAICNLFDITLTKKQANSNTENSFYQIFKGEFNSDTKVREFECTLRPDDERKFKEIKNNRC